MADVGAPEARELSLVGKVEMRVALASTDEKLQSSLNTYLPPLLLKLASEYVSVRNKVIGICQHINARIKPPSIKLPVATLLKQYKDNHNALVRHFDLLYIQHGIDRLTLRERLELLPTFLQGIANNFRESATHAASLFNLFLKLLHDMTFPPRGSKDDTELRERLGLAHSPDDVTFTATWLGKLVLLQPNATRCPGLNKEECSFLQLYAKKDTWDPTATGGLNLVETKVVASKFLASGAFADSERFLPALFASADSNSRISDIGEDIVKRATSAVSFENPDLVKSLYQVYLGSRGTDGSLPARAPLQTKILWFLCRSKLASSFVSQSTQIVQEALSPVESAQQNGNIASPKQGLEATKLRGQVFAFTNWLARISSPGDLGTFAPALVGQLRTYIESQGWPRFSLDAPANSEGGSVSGEINSRAYAYESIGLLAAACPEKLLLDPALDLLRWLFRSLSEDPSGKDLSTSIEQALGSVLGAMDAGLGSGLEMSVTSLLLHQMSLDADHSDSSSTRRVRSTRHLAVRFANRCLKFSNTTARWIDVIATQGESVERSALLEDGRKGLDPHWYKMLNPLNHDPPVDEGKYELPHFPELVDRFFGPGSCWDTRITTQVKMANAYMPALTFCRCVLLHQALTAVKNPPVIDADWERNIDALIAYNEGARAGLKVYFREFSSSHIGKQEYSRALGAYLQAAFTGFIPQNGVGGDTSRAADYILELCSLLPDSAYFSLSARILSLQEPILSTKTELRIRSSHVFGILSTLGEAPESTVRSMLSAFEQKLQAWQQAIGSELLQLHGAMLAIAYFLSRSLSRNRLPPEFKEFRSTFICLILTILSDTRDNTLLEGVFIAVSELALFGVLTPETIPEPHDMRTVVQKLTEKAKDGNEKAIMALGHLATQCNESSDEDSLLQIIVKQLYGLHTIRQAEAHFTIGDALACAAVGWQSNSLVANLDIQDASLKFPDRETTLSSILNQVLSDCRTTKPALRKASVIWLLSLVQYCGHLPDLQFRLRECQVAFKGFLADRDSLNQESASRGLTLVYEKGNKALKDDLIRDLVGSFTETKAKLTVSAETELFDVGALPTGDGSVTTYKDIMSLASEVGDSSLVYKFMSLASNNAIWSSRAAFGRFGLSNILSDASSADGYLAQNPRLYPALFRYRFDPNTHVRNSMNDIWAALVKEPAKTIDMNFDNIMKDLLRNILAKEWRVRQASCAAVADLVQGRQFEKYERYLTQIWELTFKVCDDIKESVRTAAMALATVLTGILIRGLEAGESSIQSSDAMLKHILPFLLSPSGLESGAPEVQGFARRTLLNIIKSSNGQTLRPFVPDLIGRLLALLSSIEPEMINYLHLNADKYGMTAQELDDARLRHIRGSSTLEAIERCLDFLNESSMPELQQSLDSAMESVVGLPSKVGCSRVLVSLSTRQNLIFKPYADYFLPLARKQVFDRNDTISSSYAAACGYLARLASNEVLSKQLVAPCRAFYSDSDDERHRTIAGDIVYAVSKHATDRFNSIASDILPFVFVAKHDVYEPARSLFEKTWSENVGGSRAVLLYLKEIVELASQYLDSARWSLKHTSAFAIADVVTSAGTGISDVNAKLIWPALDKALSGKTWEGKETVLKALVEYAKYSTYWSTDPTMEEQVERIMLRESRKNNLAYRQHAFGCLGDFIELRRETNMYSQAYQLIKPVVEESLDKAEEMDVDSLSGGPSSRALTESILANAASALLKSINPTKANAENLGSELAQVLVLVNRIRIEHRSRKALDAIYEAQKSLFERLHGAIKGELPEQLEAVLIEYTKQVFASVDQVEPTRVKAAEAAVALACCARQKVRIKTVFRQELAAVQALERSASVRQSLDHAWKLVDG